MLKIFKLLLPLSLIILLIIRFIYQVDTPQINLKQKVENTLRKRIDSASNIPLYHKKNLSSSDFLLQYYKTFDYSPAWIGENGQLPIADTLIAKIKESVFDGLNPSDYHLSAIETLQEELLKHKDQSEDSIVVNKWADFEILLSDAFITYAVHQYAGRIHSEKLNKEWKDHITSINVINSLKNATERNSIIETIKSFSCIHPQYKQLEGLLKRYINIGKNGGWPLLPQGTRLKIKDKNVKVITLRERLLITGELTETKVNSDSLFDSTLVEAIKKFQIKHGLKDNGTVDLATFNEMNIPVESRIKQIALNMERWRWLPRVIKQPYILVNTAGFRLDVIDNNETIMDMKIVVGMSSHSTPVFNADMTYLILNPWWEIPMSIARNEMLPEIKKDTSYFSRNNIKIYKSWKQDAKPVTVDSIEWNALDSCNFNYRLRQTPGPWNALGRIKFMFPNKYNIYLHDTPNKELFFKTVRTFSHGCIRIEHPIELATYLLRNDTFWTKEKLIMAIDSKNEQTVIIPSLVKVYICYFTVWTDKQGSPYFGKDIYMYNKELEKALFH